MLTPHAATPLQHSHTHHRRGIRDRRGPSRVRSVDDGARAGFQGSTTAHRRHKTHSHRRFAHSPSLCPKFILSIAVSRLLILSHTQGSGAVAAAADADGCRHQGGARVGLQVTAANSRPARRREASCRISDPEQKTQKARPATDRRRSPERSTAHPALALRQNARAASRPAARSFVVALKRRAEEGALARFALGRPARDGCAPGRRGGRLRN